MVKKTALIPSRKVQKWHNIRPTRRQRAVGSSVRRVRPKCGSRPGDGKKGRNSDDVRVTASPLAKRLRFLRHTIIEPHKCSSSLEAPSKQAESRVPTNRRMNTRVKKLKHDTEKALCRASSHK